MSTRENRTPSEESGLKTLTSTNSTTTSWNAYVKKKKKQLQKNIKIGAENRHQRVHRQEPQQHRVREIDLHHTWQQQGWHQNLGWCPHLDWNEHQEGSPQVVCGTDVKNSVHINKRMLNDILANINAIEVSIGKREWRNNINKKKSNLNIDIAEVNLHKYSWTPSFTVWSGRLHRDGVAWASNNSQTTRQQPYQPQHHHN